MIATFERIAEQHFPKNRLPQLKGRNLLQRRPRLLQSPRHSRLLLNPIQSPHHPRLLLNPSLTLHRQMNLIQSPHHPRLRPNLIQSPHHPRLLRNLIQSPRPRPRPNQSHKRTLYRILQRFRRRG